MASSDVVASTLLLLIPFISLGLLAYDWLSSRSTPTKSAIFVLLAILPAVAGGTALNAASGEPLRVVTKVFVDLLHGTLSGISIYALSPSSQISAFPPPFLRFFLSLAAILVACEFISALIPTSPPLLPATLALVSRVILLALSLAAAILLRRRYTAMIAESNIEKGPPTDKPGMTPGRVSSPTQATWPFPGSLALQELSKRPGSLVTDRWAAPHLLSPSSASHTLNAPEDADKMDKQCLVFLPLILVIGQFLATFSASLTVATCIFVDGTVPQTNRPLVSIIMIGSAICNLLWSSMVLVIVQILPTKPQPRASEKQAAFDCDQGQGPLGVGIDKISRDKSPLRTPNPSVSRESDSLLDFLSLRDPFASSPPPPPPLPPVGLGLDEVDVGWNGSKEIGMQYRFPAPRSIIKGGRRKGTNARVNGKKLLVHQDSTRALLPVPETRGTETDAERDKGFGDEARLAQLLLQSLIEECRSPNLNMPTPVPTVQPPQLAHVQQISRWSTSTTVQSVMSASVSNRSGVSTYATCASEKVPTSRISMNTIASVLGSRKSSEARRKSAMTTSSSKGRSL